MQLFDDRKDEKLAKEVEENVEKKAYHAAKEGVRDAKDRVARDENYREHNDGNDHHV